jgi:hypothetical protein
MRCKNLASSTDCLGEDDRGGIDAQFMAYVYMTGGMFEPEVFV